MPAWTSSPLGGWTLDLCPVPIDHSLSVHVHQHPAAPEIWCVTALQAGLDYYELGAKDGGAARVEALALLRKILVRRLAALDEVEREDGSDQRRGRGVYATEGRAA